MRFDCARDVCAVLTVNTAKQTIPVVTLLMLPMGCFEIGLLDGGNHHWFNDSQFFPSPPDVVGIRWAGLPTRRFQGDSRAIILAI